MHVIIEKQIGQTPLEALTAWRATQPNLEGVSVCYAGRLDPMASGQLLLLIGDECKEIERYRGLDKEYEIEVLLDVGSDTGDVLGIVEAGGVTDPSHETIEAVLSAEVGTHILPYPVFSSKTVSGKPLFLYALEGTLDTISIPTHEETIYSIDLLGVRTLSTNELQTRVDDLLAKAPVSDEPSKALGADFRIADVRKSWATVLTADRAYAVLSLRVRCGTGTYMRSLAGRIGERLGTRALALSIHRTQIVL